MEYLKENKVYIKLLDNINKYKILNPKVLNKQMIYKMNLARMNIEYLSMKPEKILENVCNMLDVITSKLEKNYKKRIKALRDDEINVINIRRVIVDINRDIELINNSIIDRLFKNVNNHSTLYESQTGIVSPVNVDIEIPIASVSTRRIRNEPFANSTLMEDPNINESIIARSIAYPHPFEVKKTRTKSGRIWRKSKRKTSKILGTRF